MDFVRIEVSFSDYVIIKKLPKTGLIQSMFCSCTIKFATYAILLIHSCIRCDNNISIKFKLNFHNSVKL